MRVRKLPKREVVLLRTRAETPSTKPSFDDADPIAAATVPQTIECPFLVADSVILDAVQKRGEAALCAQCPRVTTRMPEMAPARSSPER